MTAQTKKLSNKSNLKRYLPILGWLPTYDRSWLSLDIIAGLTLWGLLVPEAMAYAGIADLPPQAGLYTLVASLLVYALFGTSRHLSVGATSATAALIASVVVALGATTSDMTTYSAYAVTLVLVVGCVYLVAGLARLGWVTQFLSKPVMDGFVTGLAIFIAVGQLNKLFGVPKGDGNVFQKFFTVIKELPQANWVTFAVGALALALLFLLPRLNKKIPAGLVVLFSSLIISLAFNLNAKYGVDVVGKLPQGLPSISLPKVSINIVLEMIFPAIAIFLVGFSEALGAGREFAEKHHQEIDPNQELRAHAITNFASGLFGGMIAGGGMSGTAVQEGAGARTQIANIVTWVATVVTLLFLTPLFASLPEAVLAALIIHAVWHLIVARKLEKIRLVSRTEFLLAVTSVFGVLLFGVLPGMIIGLLASIVLVLYHSSRPHVAVLGRIPGIPGAYSDLHRHPENTIIPGVFIVRLDGPMYYANAQTVREQIKALIAIAQPPPRAMIWDSSGQDVMDITSAEVLKKLLAELMANGIEIYVAEMHAPVREFAQRSGLLEVIGENHIFPTVDAAVGFIKKSALLKDINQDGC
jgi:high affinity sulfate transporter 1